MVNGILLVDAWGGEDYLAGSITHEICFSADGTTPGV
jgi:hypothetical protein